MLRRIVVLAFLVGCGSDGGSSGATTFTTSVSSSAMLSMLSSAQQMQLCTDLKAFASSSSIYADAQDAGCRLAGILTAALSSASTDQQLQTTCTNAYNSCKSQAPGMSSTTVDACTTPPSTCTATVGELTQCLNDEFAGLHDALASIPQCSALTKGTFTGDGGLFQTPATPASCQTFNTKCPKST